MEESQTNQQPAKVEGEADVLDLPVGLVSGSLASVSAETLENPVPPLQWNLAAEMEEAIEHLMKTLLNEVETNVEQRLNKMDIKKDDPPEEDAKSTKRYTRRGTRGKGRGIIYQRDNNPQDGAKDEIRVSAHRTGAEGLRETLHQTEKEGNTVALKCGRLTKGPVTWSRDTNGQRVDILTTHNGETTKHITDPDRRYGSRKDPVLIIYGVSQSDAGRYDCSGATVELSVTSGTEASTTEGSSERPSQDLWKVLTTVTVSCLVAVVLVLLSWICFYKRKGYAVKHNQEHVYDSIDDTMPTAQPVSDQQRTEEPIYYLASHPGAQTTDNQQSAYEAIDPPEEHATPQERVDQLCSLIKKPTK
ncbi:hypothetical protein SRHO_G00100000 [Serrasalmus rhombeus]